MIPVIVFAISAFMFVAHVFAYGWALKHQPASEDREYPWAIFFMFGYLLLALVVLVIDFAPKLI